MEKLNRHSENDNFNYAIWLYEMNADDVFDHDRHLIVDSSLGLIEDGPPPKPDPKAK